MTSSLSQTMKAVILAAGSGKRLGILSEGTPKCLLLINGRPLIEYQLNALERAGISEIIVVTGYLGDMVKSFCQRRCRIVNNPLYETTNSIYSLWLTKPYLVGHDFLYLNSDVIYEEQLLLDFIRHEKKTACLIDKTIPYSADEYKLLVKDGYVTGFSKEILPEESGGESTQLDKISAEDSVIFFDRMEEIIRSGGTDKFPSAAYDTLIQNSSVAAVFTEGRKWFEIDTLDDYENCAEYLSESTRKTNSTKNRFPQRWKNNKALQSLNGLLKRTNYYEIFKEWLRSLIWVTHFVPALFVRPVRACRLLKSLYSGELTCYGFDLQLYGPILLRTVLQEARRLEIRPFLIWGTLLGYVRDGGLIKNDCDIDLGVLKEDFDKIQYLKEAMLKKGFLLKIDTQYKLSLKYPGCEVLHVDIDLIYEKEGHMVMTNSHRDDQYYYSYYFPRDAFAELKSVKFEDGIDILIPASPEKFLKTVYGDWRTPQPKAHYIYGPLNLVIEPRT